MVFVFGIRQTIIVKCYQNVVKSKNLFIVGYMNMSVIGQIIHVTNQHVALIQLQNNANIIINLLIHLLLLDVSGIWLFMFVNK